MFYAKDEKRKRVSNLTLNEFSNYTFASKPSNSNCTILRCESNSASAIDNYTLKRQRNNAAVNKTRQKKRQEEQQTQMRVQKLRDENEKLERRLESMKKELKLLKELVIACATGQKLSSKTLNVKDL